jgi:hypothetical protein
MPYCERHLAVGIEVKNNRLPAGDSVAVSTSNADRCEARLSTLVRSSSCRQLAFRVLPGISE